MSKFIASKDFVENEWQTQFISNDPYCIEILFEFRGETNPLFFRNLKFGYILVNDNKIIKHKSYPESNEKYVSSDQQFLASDFLTVKPTVTYTLNFWCEHDGVFTEGSSTINIEKPSTLFDSWVWEDYRWNPPLPYPEDDKNYTWNEDEQSWDLVPEES
jgi:hypothetical protein